MIVGTDIGHLRAAALGDLFEHASLVQPIGGLSTP